MTNPFAPLSEDEFDELDQLLLYDVDTEESMTLDMVDGFLHALAVGPTTVPPKWWLPKIWGTKEMMPPMNSIEELNHILGLVMRHFNSIISGLEEEPRVVSPGWSTMTYEGDEREYDDAEMWAYGFVEAMRLCWDHWQPSLSIRQGQAWFRPIALLGEDDFSVDQDELTKTPAMRAELALQIPQAVLDMMLTGYRSDALSMSARWPSRCNPRWAAMSLALVGAARSSRSAAQRRVTCIEADRGLNPKPVHCVRRQASRAS